jgi:thiamine pyrophosphate-dependent acetolactate synthase large subunit-like protein
MKYMECMNFLAGRRDGQLVVTSAGQSRSAWWQATHDRDATFYLGASMSMSTMFGLGLAVGLPDAKVWAFMGDGAFCMNPGMLMVEREVNPPNLIHILMSNRHYGATGNQRIPNRSVNDYVAMAKSVGIERAYKYDGLADLEQRFDSEVLGNKPAYTFVVMEIEPQTEKLERCPIDGPELKYAFGRYIERTMDRRVFK